MKNPIVFFLVVVLLTACSSPTPMEVTGFPLEKGTTWVYSYEAYDPAPFDPEQVIHASYQVTDTVVDTETVSDYLVAHVVRNWKLVKADPDWQRDLSSQLREFWYVRDGQQIYQSNLPLDTSNLHLDQLILDYEFPLSNGKSWCLLPDARGAGQSSGCDFVGKRQVTAYGPYTTPAGTFKSCYDLTDSYNGGNILQKFCDGAGIVYMKFDHAGTKFGFEQTLSSLSPGTP